MISFLLTFGWPRMESKANIESLMQQLLFQVVQNNFNLTQGPKL
jgi:hypothetical protein